MHKIKSKALTTDKHQFALRRNDSWYLRIQRAGSITKSVSYNNGFKKLAVQWLQEVLFSNETFVVTDSLRLRNRLLLKPANRSRHFASLV